MAEKASRSILNAVYTVLIILAIFMHMSISGLEIGGLIIGIFTEPTGIITFFREILVWGWKFLFRAHTIYMVGTILILWFVVLPLLVRLRYIQVDVSLMLSVTVTLYVFLVLKMYNLLPV